MSSETEREAFYSACDQFAARTGHKPSMLDVWLMARGVMRTDGLASHPAKTTTNATDLKTRLDPVYAALKDDDSLGAALAMERVLLWIDAAATTPTAPTAHPAEPPCAECGQVDAGQHGEYHCAACGLPKLWADADGGPAEPPRQSLEEAIQALVDALAHTKGWMRGYADAIIRDAIDRRGAEPSRTVTGDPSDDRPSPLKRHIDPEVWDRIAQAFDDDDSELAARGTITGDGAGELPEALERIAAEWDGCLYEDAPGGAIEVGAALRQSFAAVAQAIKGQGAEPGAATKEDFCGVDQEVRTTATRSGTKYSVAKWLCPNCAKFCSTLYIDDEWCHGDSLSISYRDGLREVKCGSCWLTEGKPGAAALTDEQRDAARYRWLRRRVPGGTYRIMDVIYNEGGVGVDAAIDDAMNRAASQP